MNAYFVFGKSGSGKSFLGNYLQKKYHFYHFDGDQILTSEMKDLITQGEKFTQPIIDQYTQTLKNKINDCLNTYHQPIIISQGMYRNKNRIELLQQFPGLQLVFIHAKEQTCYERIKKRNNWVTVDYAKKINMLFEQPAGFPFAQINNDSDDPQKLDEQICLHFDVPKLI